MQVSSSHLPPCVVSFEGRNLATLQVFLQVLLQPGEKKTQNHQKNHPTMHVKNRNIELQMHEWAIG